MSDLEVRRESELSAEECKRFASPALKHHALYARHSTERTQAFMAKVYRSGRLLGLAPVIRMARFRATLLLEPEVRRRLDPWMGPFARKTTYLVDTSFMGFQYAQPFLVLDPADFETVRGAVVAHLRASRDAATLMVFEPLGDPSWSRALGAGQFKSLPYVHADLSGCATTDDYLVKLDQKRRKNWRSDRRVFEREGGSFEVHEPPLAPELMRTLHRCLIQSSEKNAELTVPYQDLMLHPGAFAEASQTAVVARVDGQVAGFFAGFRNGDVFQQCHGGFNYAHAHRLKAYPNLINASIEHAISLGCRELTMGPLNNEAKRRAGRMMPMMASWWSRGALDRFLMRRLLLERMQFHQGSLEN
jgi:hypothetical protein